MEDYWHKSWACPFFQRSLKRVVLCEGGSRVAFEDAETFQEYVGNYCATVRGYKNCSIAAALLQKYEKEEEKELEKQRQDKAARKSAGT